MRGALDTHRDLLARDVPHEVVRLDRSLTCADELPEVLGLSPASCVVLRCYVTDRAFAAVMLRAGDTADPVRLLDALDAASVRPATADEISAATDQAAALVGPVGLPDHVLLLSDTGLGNGPTDVRYTTTGEPGVALGIRLHHLLIATGARAATLTAPTAEPPARDATVIDLVGRPARRRA